MLQVVFCLTGIVCFVVLAAVAVGLFTLVKPAIAELRIVLPLLIEALREMPSLARNVRETSDFVSDMNVRVKNLRETTGSIGAVLAQVMTRKKSEDQF